MRKSVGLTFCSALILAGALCAVELDPSTMSEAEWTEYRFERLAVVRANPDLAAASQQLKADTEKQEQAVEAAMVKADPSIASLLARRAALLKGNWHAPAEADALSWADWQKLRAARAAALTANPGLIAANADLKEKKNALEARVDAVLVKADPGLAGLVEKLNKRDAN